MIDITKAANNGVQLIKKQRCLFDAKLSKCIAPGIIEVANNSVQPVKKQKRLFGTKSGKCTLSVKANLSPYNFYLLSQILILTRCSE